MIVTKDDVSAALEHLAQTDTECAKAYGMYKGLEDITKSVYSECFQQVEGKTIADREAAARNHGIYRTHIGKLGIAREAYEELKLQRDLSALRIDVWKSENYANAKGLM